MVSTIIICIVICIFSSLISIYVASNMVDKRFRNTIYVNRNEYIENKYKFSMYYDKLRDEYITQSINAGKSKPILTIDTDNFKDYHDSIQPFYDNDDYYIEDNSKPIFKIVGGKETRLKIGEHYVVKVYVKQDPKLKFDY